MVEFEIVTSASSATNWLKRVLIPWVRNREDGHEVVIKVETEGSVRLTCVRNGFTVQPVTGSSHSVDGSRCLAKGDYVDVQIEKGDQSV